MDVILKWRIDILNMSSPRISGELTVSKRSTVISRIAMLSALVVILDYTMKFSGLKIPFPWLPFLKFDLTGIPIVLSTLMMGLKAGVFTSVVALLAILVRSGDFIGASMKAMAELSTVVGFYIGCIIAEKKQGILRVMPYIAGCLIRILVMFILTLPVFTLYYGIQLSAALAISPLVASFNLIHGLLSIFGGKLLYEALKRRIPAWILNVKG